MELRNRIHIQQLCIMITSLRNLSMISKNITKSTSFVSCGSTVTSMKNQQRKLSRHRNQPTNNQTAFVCFHIYNSITRSNIHRYNLSSAFLQQKNLSCSLTFWSKFSFVLDFANSYQATKVMFCGWFIKVSCKLQKWLK
jgi:hypothetical protein